MATLTEVEAKRLEVLKANEARTPEEETEYQALIAKEAK